MPPPETAATARVPSLETAMAVQFVRGAVLVVQIDPPLNEL